MRENCIFVNYRVGDEENTASFLARRLADEFGAANVFKASSSIPVGAEYDHAILAAVAQSTIFLAVIGPRWVSVQNKNGVRRLEDEADWVRRELAEALHNGERRVIPVLVGATPALREEDLPPILQGLAKRQYLRLHYRSMDADTDRLVDELVAVVPDLRDERSGAVLDRFPVEPTLVTLPQGGLAGALTDLWPLLSTALSTTTAPHGANAGTATSADLVLNEAARYFRAELLSLEEALRPYAERSDLIDSRDDSLRRRLARLRAAMETVFDRHLTFPGEQRDRVDDSVVVVQEVHDVGKDGQLYGTRDRDGTMTQSNVRQTVHGSVDGLAVGHERSSRP